MLNPKDLNFQGDERREDKQQLLNPKMRKRMFKRKREGTDKGRNKGNEERRGK